MAITFHIPGPLRVFADGRRNVQIEASPVTLRQALDVLWTVCPGIRDRVLTEQGDIREHVAVFVGNENVRDTGGLATSLAPGAEISIVPNVSGG